MVFCGFVALPVSLIQKASLLQWLKTGKVPQLTTWGAWRYQWADQMLPIKHINQSSGELVFDCSNSECDMSYWPPSHSMPYFVQDLLQELDQPGEVWLERSTGMLFIYPPDSARGVLEVSTPVEWPSAELDEAALVRFVGVRSLRWEGIAIGQSRGTAVHAVNCTGLSLINVSVRGMAVQAAVVSGGSNVTLSGWDVAQTGAGGVTLSGGDHATLTPCGHQLIESDISDTDRWVHYESPPVKQIGVGTRVAHTFVHDVKHHAFRLEGNDHLIEANLVKRTLLEAWDAGTFHTGRDLTWQGNKLIDNVFMNNDSDATANFPCIGTTTSCAKVAIYLDDHQSGVTVTSNVISGFVGVFLHFGRNNNVSNNLFIGDGLSVAVAACEVNDTTCNPPLSDPANALAASLNATMSLPEWETVWLPHYPALRNVTWSPGATVNNTVSWITLLCRSSASQ